MKGDPKVIEFLNQAFKNELTAINQYFLHSRMLRDWGVCELAQKEHEESIEEMEHADWLIERILFLEGLPNLQDLGKLFIGETVQEILECDLKTEQMAVPVLRDGIEYCEKVRDYGSRDLSSTRSCTTRKSTSTSSKRSSTSSRRSASRTTSSSSRSRTPARRWRSRALDK